MQDKKSIGNKQDFDFLHIAIVMSLILAIYCITTAIMNPLEPYFFTCFLIGNIQLGILLWLVAFRIHLLKERIILRTKKFTLKSKNGETWVEYERGFEQ